MNRHFDCQRQRKMGIYRQFEKGKDTIRHEENLNRIKQFTNEKQRQIDRNREIEQQSKSDRDGAIDRETYVTYTHKHIKERDRDTDTDRDREIARGKEDGTVAQIKKLIKRKIGG